MAHAVTGPFDVIAFVEVPDLDVLSDLVLSRIHRVKGVEKTQTAVVVTPMAVLYGVRERRGKGSAVRKGKPRRC